MGQGSNTYTVDIKTSFVKRFDQNGTVWIEAIAHGTLIAKTPYFVTVDEYGHKTRAIDSSGNYYYVGIPNKNCVEGEKVWLQIGGVCEDVITPELTAQLGGTFHIADGAIAVKATNYNRLAIEFAVCIEASNASTLQQMNLIPEALVTSPGGIGL